MNLKKVTKWLFALVFCLALCVTSALTVSANNAREEAFAALQTEMAQRVDGAVLQAFTMLIDALENGALKVDITIPVPIFGAFTVDVDFTVYANSEWVAFGSRLLGNGVTGFALDEIFSSDLFAALLNDEALLNFDEIEMLASDINISYNFAMGADNTWVLDIFLKDEVHGERELQLKGEFIVNGNAFTLRFDGLPITISSVFGDDVPKVNLVKFDDFDFAQIVGLFGMFF